MYNAERSEDTSGARPTAAYAEPFEAAIDAAFRSGLAPFHHSWPYCVAEGDRCVGWEENMVSRWPVLCSTMSSDRPPDRSEHDMPAQAPPSTDESQLLLAFLAQQRDGIRHAAHGLTDDQARLTPTAGSLSIGGLVKHAAQMERTWVDTMLQRARPPADYEEGFRLGPEETLAHAVADLAAAARETEAAVGGVQLADPVPVPKGVPWFPDDVDAWTVRWVLLHLNEELARHAGHADIVRESIDGATAYELMAAAEGWPATDWLQPWESPQT